MTLEERVAALEDAVMGLSALLEAKTGPYARDVNPAVSGEGEQIHRWIESVLTHREGT
jgi:hypothetical protein